MIKWLAQVLMGNKWRRTRTRAEVALQRGKDEVETLKRKKGIWRRYNTVKNEREIKADSKPSS